ncbi:MAG: hypothetical protein IH935_12570 [Acidobacteria bacterium]|nr:hypothetical protein [Acidobacteriota bacterium]
MKTQGVLPASFARINDRQELEQMKSPLSKGTLVGIVFGAVFLLLILYQTMGMRQYECEVCVEIDGRTHCMSVKAETEQLAIQTARDNACSVLAGNRAESFRCSQTPPTSIRCKQL